MNQYALCLLLLTHAVYAAEEAREEAKEQQARIAQQQEYAACKKAQNQKKLQPHQEQPKPGAHWGHKTPHR